MEEIQENIWEKLGQNLREFRKDFAELFEIFWWKFSKNVRFLGKIKTNVRCQDSVVVTLTRF